MSLLEHCSRLLSIHTKMAGWTNLGKIMSFVQQDDIAKDIAMCHTQITDTLNTFHVRHRHAYIIHCSSWIRLQLTSHFEIHEWMAEFKENQELDHKQLVESLSEIKSSQAIVEAKMNVTMEQVQQMMVMLQTVRLES